MSVVNPEMDAQAQAERWLIRMDDQTCSSMERERFEQWRATPEHAAAYERAQWLWSTLGELAGREDFERLSAEVIADTAPAARHPRTRRWASALAASVAVVVLGTGAFFVGQHYTPTRTFVTGPGQRSTVQLDDGSQLILNFDTHLDVKLNGDRRQFTLKSGEAVFRVAEDPNRPFVVSVGDGEVTALGTRFQIRNEAQKVTVTLLEGRVALERSRSDQHVQLTPGEQVRFTTQVPGMSRRTVDPDVVSSWTTGRLRFRQTPLVEVLEEVNRYSKMKIRLQDASLGRTPIHVTIEVGDTSSLISALESMLPLEASPRGNGEILLTSKSGR